MSDWYTRKKLLKKNVHMVHTYIYILYENNKFESKRNREHWFKYGAASRKSKR